VHMVGDKMYFRHFFSALGPCIQVREGCRPYLSVDSTTLIDRWNGQLASAIGVDGHNWMYPVAFGFFFDSETHENWTWFMIHLQRAIGNLPLLEVSTDACKGLENAVKVVFSHAKQMECFRYMIQNYVKRFLGGVEHMYPAARAYRKIIHDHTWLLLERSRMCAIGWTHITHSCGTEAGSTWK
jgi:hypothetical protein